MLMNLLEFLLPAIASLFGGAFFLRAYLHKIRVWYQDPLFRFSMALTDWWTLRVRRFMPTWRGIDWASVSGLFFIAFMVALILNGLHFGGRVAWLGVLCLILVNTVSYIFHWCIFLIGFFAVLQMLVSFVRLPLVDQVFVRLLEPFLRPIRKVIKPKHGFDFSLFALILIIGCLSIIEMSVVNDIEKTILLNFIPIKIVI